MVLARSDYNPAAEGGPAAEAAVHNPGGHSDPTDSAAAAAAVAMVAGPRAGAAGATRGAGKRIADVRGVTQGCTGVGLGCSFGLIVAGVEIGRIVGRILGEEEVAGRNLLLSLHKIAEVT